jgi:aryl-alcohol dehydrogenase-like predicted oxidoreductase
VALEPHYNLLHREPFESELRPLAQQHELGVLPYFGLAAGFLTGKYRSSEDAEGVTRGSMVAAYLNDAGFAVADQVRAIAEQRGVAPASVALAWLRAQPSVVAPIAGATKVEQVPPSLAAATLELDASELGRLERVSDAFASA